MLMETQDFNSIVQLFIEDGNPSKVESMKSYMKGKFEYAGITSPERKRLIRHFFQGYQWDRKELLNFVGKCWECEIRELQYVAMDILRKNQKLLTIGDLAFVEQLLLKKSWWDTVDGLAVNIVGGLLKSDIKVRREWIRKWANSDNIWLRRAAILHQLKYKDLVDVPLMEMTLKKANGTKEFFLNKAIGWILREYARLNPDYVRDYVDNHSLSNLSRREALKHLN